MRAMCPSPAPSPIGDEDLLYRFQSGDPALRDGALFIDHFGGYVTTVAASLVKRRYDLQEDVIQETWVALLSNETVARFDPARGGAARHYLFGLLRNAWKKVRRRPVAVSLEDADAVERDHRRPDFAEPDPAQLAERRDDAQRALRCADRPTRALVRCLYEDGLSLQEAAALIGVSRFKAGRIHRSFLSRARALLQAA